MASRPRPGGSVVLAEVHAAQGCVVQASASRRPARRHRHRPSSLAGAGELRIRLVARHGGLQLVHDARVVLGVGQEALRRRGPRHGARRRLRASAAAARTRQRAGRAGEAAPGRRRPRPTARSRRPAGRLRPGVDTSWSATTSSDETMAASSRAARPRAPSKPRRCCADADRARASARSTPGWVAGWFDVDEAGHGVPPRR